MKIVKIFKEIFKGLAIENDDRYEKIDAYLIDTKDVENCMINYDNSGLQPIAMKIKDKYFLKNGDIIISTRPSENTCHVGYVSNNNDEKIAIPKKNFVILRNPIKEYIPEFVAEYLEIIGIYDYINNNGIQALTIQDIEDIDIPKIPIEKQKEFVLLTNPINERSSLYKILIKNDIEIKKHILKEVIENEK